MSFASDDTTKGINGGSGCALCLSPDDDVAETHSHLLQEAESMNLNNYMPHHDDLQDETSTTKTSTYNNHVKRPINSSSSSSSTNTATSSPSSTNSAIASTTTATTAFRSSSSSTTATTATSALREQLVRSKSRITLLESELEAASAKSLKRDAEIRLRRRADETWGVELKEVDDPLAGNADDAEATWYQLVDDE